ncbi:hypothetical protein [Roseospirillum parvum]|uniref:D-glycero-alpha-D-manno-heptose-7-phosphate kinase n=1 Tax=Roseospirillum parvum TaxID=83401 RepID=A0A1G7TX63_9PROT|nr:hypothetical protein [Roseospirillum parvum]SDG39339.1 D-glycero-alpha-D-manno-heptose-7-phosphate kinase [Roseospirillum parvum]
MIVRARAPLRLSFGGGGTELSPYMERHGGLVLNATINLHASAILGAAPPGEVHLIAGDRGHHQTLPARLPLDEAGPLPLHAGVYNHIMETFCGGEALPLTLTTHSEAPVGSGLGASSTLTVAMLKAFDEYLNLALGEYELARAAYQVERGRLGLKGGRQDQYAAAFGGFNLIEFHRDDRVIVNPLRIRNWIVSELEASLILYFTGLSHQSGDIIVEQTRRMDDPDGAITRHMHRIKELAVVMKEALLKGRIADLAGHLNASWAEKRATAGAVSTAGIDALYEQMRGLGVLGGKLSGAGGGGFMMLLCPPERRARVEAALAEAGGRVFSAKFTSIGAESWRVADSPFADLADPARRTADGRVLPAAPTSAADGGAP